LRDLRVDAVATVHLLNFVGNVLHKDRENFQSRGFYFT